MLRPRGRFFFSVWDAIGKNEFADVVTQALAAVFPRDPPMFMARTPHGYHNVETIREELAAAGLQIFQSKRSITPAEPRRRGCSHCVLSGTPLRNEIEARGAARLEEATKAAANALANRFGNGPIEGRIRPTACHDRFDAAGLRRAGRIERSPDGVKRNPGANAPQISDYASLHCQ